MTDPVRPPSRTIRLVAASAGIALVWIVAASVLAGAPRSLLPVDDPSWMTAAGSSNRVTAVVLVFRGFDTLIELAVLAAVTMAIVGEPRAGLTALAPPPIAETLAKAGAPLAAMVAAYLLWAGSDGVGGAFQAGAVLAGAGLLAEAGGLPNPLAPVGGWRRLAVALGALAFVIAAAIPLVQARPLLAPGPPALLLVVESAAALSVAVILTILYGAIGHPVTRPP